MTPWLRSVLNTPQSFCNLVFNASSTLGITDMVDSNWSQKFTVDWYYQVLVFRTTDEHWPHECHFSDVPIAPNHLLNFVCVLGIIKKYIMLRTNYNIVKISTFISVVTGNKVWWNIHCLCLSIEMCCKKVANKEVGLRPRAGSSSRWSICQSIGCSWIYGISPSKSKTVTVSQALQTVIIKKD